jgi:hypothetical protein
VAKQVPLHEDKDAEQVHSLVETITDDINKQKLIESYKPNIREMVDRLGPSIDRHDWRNVAINLLCANLTLEDYINYVEQVLLDVYIKGGEYASGKMQSVPEGLR